MPKGLVAAFLVLVSAATLLVQVIPAAASGAATPMTAGTTKQYQLANSNGSTWVTMDPAGLSVTFTPTANSFATIGGNADLWTATAGVNQDLGISVSGGVYPSVAGQPEAWKESGGNGGNFSPNAAFVETLLAVMANMTYTVTLQWKANHPTTGTIFAGAGTGPAFSPTRMTVQVEPSATLTPYSSTVTRAQLRLDASNGSTWQDMTGTDTAFTPLQNGVLLVSGNADLWTANAGVGQDLGIAVSDGGRGTYPTVAGQPEAWKESGGFNGTFSPKAAYVRTSLLVVSGIPYDIKLQWKANHATSGSIFAGAGPINGQFSPTTLTLQLIPGADSLTLGTNAYDVASTQQYRLNNSDGSTWVDIDPTALNLSITPPANCTAILNGSADMWTATAGVNQDLRINVTPSGATPANVGWKESGGVVGTFSPNAAFVQSIQRLSSGVTYSVRLQWKANHNAPGSSIFVGAGPINGHLSPTHLAAQLACP